MSNAVRSQIIIFKRNEGYIFRLKMMSHHQNSTHNNTKWVYF